MPTYAYECLACGREFERLVRISSRDRDARCPGCESRKVRRLPPRGVSLAFRGSGTHDSDKAGEGGRA